MTDNYKNIKSCPHSKNLDNANETEAFIGSSAKYYEEQFRIIGSTSGFTFTFNFLALILGPIWYGMRGIWNWCFAFVICEVFSLVQISRAMLGDLAIEERNRLSTVSSQIELRQAQLEAAIKKGVEDLSAFERKCYPGKKRLYPQD